MNIAEHVENIKSEVKKIDTKLFAMLAVVGLVIYSSMIVYELPNPDTVWNGIYYKNGWEMEASMGRFMLRIFQDLFGHVISPSTYTIINVIIVAFIGVVVCDIFALKGISAVLSGLFLMCSPAIAGTLTYYYCSLYYIIAYLLACMASWIICKKSGWLYSMLAMVILCISMGTYQTYIGVVLVIAVIYTLQMIFREKAEFLEILKRVVYMAVSAAGGVIFYLISCKWLLKRWGVEIAQGRGFSEMGQIPLKELGTMLRNCYVNVYRYFFSNELINNNYGNKETLNKVCFVIMCVLFLYILIKMKKGWLHRITAIMVAFVFPIAMMSITIAASKVSIYDTTGVIMLPTMNYFYILIICIMECIDGNELINIGKKTVVYLSTGAILFSLFVFCLSMQTYHKTCMNRMDFLAKEIAMDIEDMVDDSGKYTLCFAGKVEDGNYPELYPQLRECVQWTTASYGIVWDTFGGTQKCWIRYMKQYTGKEYEDCGIQEYEMVTQSEFFKEMNNYPDENSMAIFEDSIIVIKLGNI